MKEKPEITLLDTEKDDNFKITLPDIENNDKSTITLLDKLKTALLDITNNDKSTIPLSDKLKTALLDIANSDKPIIILSDTEKDNEPKTTLSDIKKDDKPKITLLDTTKESEELFQVAFRLQKLLQKLNSLQVIYIIVNVFGGLFIFLIDRLFSWAGWVTPIIIGSMGLSNIYHLTFRYIITRRIVEAIKEGEKLHWGLVLLGDKNRFLDRDYSLPTPAKSAMSLYLEHEKEWKRIKTSFIENIVYIYVLIFSFFLFFIFLTYIFTFFSNNITTTPHQQEKQHLQHQIDSLQRENKRLLEENKQLKNK